MVVMYAHVTALEDPVTLPVLVNLVPVSQTNQNAPCNILEHMNEWFAINVV